MSIIGKMKKIIYLVLAIIQILLLLLLFIHYPLPENMKDYSELFNNIIIAIFILFIIAIICYICEHKIYNKNESLLDYNLIEPKFDIDFKNYDILYLSTILNQKLPGKKGIILLIMQLINKKILDLSCYYDGNKYQYVITKRNTYYTKNITKAESILIDYIFKNSNRVNLINSVKEIYSIKNKDINYIEHELYDSIEINNLIKHSGITIIYKILTVLISALIFFIGIIVLEIFLYFNFKNSVEVIITFLAISLLCIVIAFICTIILKKLNYSYQYNNDACLWILRNIIFINTCLIFSYLFSSPLIIQYFIIIIYIFTTLTIMIKYNTHISLYNNDIIVRNRLLSLKKYFESMNYLTDKEFGNIITYEECIMYGFLFNITIKINKEFDILQKELFEIIKSEGKLYLKLFKSNI